MNTNQTIDGVYRKIQEGELVMSTERIRKEFEVFRKEAIAAFARMGFQNPDRCIRDTASLWSGWQAGWQAAIETMKNPSSQADGEPVHQCQKCWGHGVVPTRRAGEGETSYRNRCKLYANPPAPVAPTAINYGALDPVERLAVCRGEVAPVAVPRLEMSHVVRAHMEIPGCPVLTSNQCHTLAMKLNASLDELKRLNGIDR